MFVIDLVKGRRKGSVNESHKWVARYRTVGSDKWQYILPDDKEVDEEGNLQDTKPITVIRRFFGVEKPSEVEKRNTKGIKAPVPYAQTQQPRLVTEWGTDKEGNRVAVGRKVVGKEITPYGTVAALEMSPKYADQVREFPDSITQFLATSEQQAAYHARAKEVPVGSGGGVVPTDHTKVPPGDSGNIHVVIPIDGVHYDANQLLGGEADVKTRSAVSQAKIHKYGSPKGAKTSSGPGSTALVVKISKHDPKLVEKYENEGELEEALQARPYASQMTAGTFRATPKNESRLFDEWKNDIYRIARNAVKEALVHSKTYQDRYTADHASQIDPYNQGSSASGFLKEQTQELYQVMSAKFIELAREYEPKPDDKNDRFDKWMLSKMSWGSRHYTEGQAKRHQAELPIDIHEASDVSARELSPLDVADYKKYAPLAKQYLEAAVESLPESQRKVIQMRLWLDSPESENEEKKDIRHRTGNEEENSWEAPSGSQTRRALKNFERSFSDIALKTPGGWKSPNDERVLSWDVKNPDPSIAQRELNRATDTLERWYKSGLKTVLQHFVSSKENKGVEGEDQVHDARTGLTFNPQGYAVYRALDIATKMARSVKPRAMPSSTIQPTTSEVFQQVHLKPHSERVAAKYPELSYFEKHPELVRRLGLAQGAVKMSAYGKKTAETGTSFVPAPVPRKYGLPETYVKNRPLSMTPEQSRRHQAIKTTHKFMQSLGGLSTSDLKSRLKQHKEYVSKVREHLGKKTPERFIDHLRWIASGKNGLVSSNHAVRAKVEKQVIEMAKEYHDASMRLGVQSPSQDVVNVVQSLPVNWDKLPTDARQSALSERYRHFSQLDLEGSARSLSSALRAADDQEKMLQYAHENRTGSVKPGVAKATVDTFMSLIEDYNDALNKALERIAS